IDISTPTTPDLKGTYSVPYVQGVAISGQYAYIVGDQFGLQIIDISDPTQPSMVGAYETAGDDAFSVTINGNYAYVGDGGDGLQIIDITDPAHPTLAGSYDTSGFSYGVAINGNYAYVADDTAGLQVIDISAPDAFSTASDTVSLSVVSNTAPVITNLDNSSASNFDENGTPIVLDSDVTVADTELDALNGGAGNYNGASITIARNGGADTQDVFGNTASLGVLTQGTTFTYNSTTVGTVTTNSAGTLKLTFNANATSAIVDSVLQSITYSNSSDDPISPTLNWTFNDGTTDSDVSQIIVNINTANDAPTLTATGTTTTFNEGGAAVDLFNAVTVSTVESGEGVTNIHLTVSNVVDTNENISIDGTTVTLVNGTTNGASMFYTVTMSGTTATVNIGSNDEGGLVASEFETVLDGITYSNSSADVTSGDRVITITRIIESTDAAETEVSIASTVTVAADNSSPTLDATKSPALANIAPNSAAPINGSTTGATLVSALVNTGVLANYSDADADAAGIAITGKSASGTLYYSTDSGDTWTEVGAVSATSAQVLKADANTYLYFEPNADFSGDISDALTFKAWDQTGAYTNAQTGVDTVGEMSLAGTVDTTDIAFS
ncbi:MAG: hypothetical protein HQL31_07155, partial [Planctomycetes bacterium]|nr:hypothetical protein [Planctomycetota bacterium]